MPRKRLATPAILTGALLAACSGRLTVLTSDDGGLPDANQGTPMTSTGAGGATGGSTSGSGGATTAGTGGASTTGGTGGAITGGSGGVGGAGSGGTAGILTGGAGGAGTGGGGGTGGTVDEDAACVAKPYDEKVLPSDLQIVANSSWSMDCPWGAPSPGCNHLDAGIPGGPTRWTVLSDAIQRVVTFLVSRGASIGLLTAPRVIAGGTYCNPGGSASQTVRLPGAVDEVFKALAQQPREGASLLALPLSGALTDAKSYVRVSGRRAHVATVFDGESDFKPCADDTIEQAEVLANSGYVTNPSIHTTPIGIGLGLTELDAVAIAGGTTKARLVDTNMSAADATQALTMALRAAAMSCEIEIPAAIGGPSGFDPATLNLDVILDNFGQRRQQYAVDRAASCAVPAGSGTEEGWYYDNPAKPTKVVFCPRTCEALARDDTPGVSFLVGCKTKLRPPLNTSSR